MNGVRSHGRNHQNRQFSTPHGSGARAPAKTLLLTRSDGARIEVTLDSNLYIQLDDSPIAAADAVGVWTKADSVTAFDDFFHGSF